MVCFQGFQTVSIAAGGRAVLAQRKPTITGMAGRLVCILNS